MKRLSLARTIGAIAITVPLLLVPATAAPAASPVTQVSTAHSDVLAQTFTGRGGGSSSSGGRSVSSPRGSSGSSSSSRSSSSGSSSSGRNVTSPRNSNNKSTNSGSSSGSSSKKNNGGGSLFGSSSSKKNKAPTTSYGDASKVSSGKASVPSSARATSRTYNTNGYTYVYNRGTYRTYYSTYHGGYPAYGTPLYWQLVNDPYYYPNYALVGSPWYHHPYPAGFVVQNGDFVAPASYDTPVSSGHGFGYYLVWTLFWILIIAALIFGALFFLRKRPRQRFGGHIR